MVASHPFLGVHLKWPVERRVFPFAIRVVEPRKLDPPAHAQVLSAVVESLLRPPPVPLGRFDRSDVPPAQRHYDLVTFPEAFATSEAILDVAKALARNGPSGCLHVGLRPSACTGSHLFNMKQIRELLVGMDELVDATLGDLKEFKVWLARQVEDHVFNLGCVLAVDAKSRLRICLHPKLVRSKFEVNPLPERHMEEANLLTLITLESMNPRFGSVTLQPLICSDALDIGTDRGLPAPVPAVSQHADCLPDPPDHVDVVSVATCTPQPSGTSADGTPFRLWHAQFQRAFISAAEGPDRGRHHFASFVLANYTEISSSLGGGLSGAFLPMRPAFKRSEPAASVSCWGRHKTAPAPNNDWSKPDDHALTAWSNLGFVAGLDPFEPGVGSAARVLAFDIHRLPRETSLWHGEASLVRWEVADDEVGSTGGHQLTRRGSHV